MRILTGVIGLLALLAVLVANPVTVYLATSFRGFAAFAALFDFWALLIAVAGVLYLWRRRAAYGYAMAGLVVLLPAVLLAGEAGYVWHRLQHDPDYLTSHIGEAYQDDDQLVYRMRGEATAHQELPGVFSAEFTTDARGRKLIDQQGAAERTIHVFGDAYTFGLGVSNRDTWLNLLTDRLGDTTNVLNYGVPGYSLEQMFLSLRRNADEIAPGDLVLFTLASVDLERNLVGRAYVCSRMAQPGMLQRFPRLEGGRWLEQDLGEACSFLFDGVLGSSPFPIGLGKLYRSWRRWHLRGDILANADRILAAARDLAQAHGGRFQVVFLATPEECRQRAFTIDLAGLATPHGSLLPYCPSDPAAAAEMAFTREPHERHWNERGNQWAAEALNQLLDQEIVGRDAGGRRDRAARL